jgi:Nucleotidyl transferase AbiEii toxin, Type IV TA system
MATDKPRNMSASIRQRLLNHSAAIKTDPNLVLIWYGLERFLYRLAVSTHSDRFVLKGAMLFRLWGGADFRSTKDLDLEGFLQGRGGGGPGSFRWVREGSIAGKIAVRRPWTPM